MTEERLGRVRDAIRPVASLEELGHALVTSLQAITQIDRLNIGLIDHTSYTFQDAFVYGQNVAGREIANVRTLDGTIVEAAIRSGGTFAFANDDLAVWLEQFPHFEPVYRSGMRRMLAVMIGGTAQPTHALVLAATCAEAFDDALVGGLKQCAPLLADKLAELGA